MSVAVTNWRFTALEFSVAWQHMGRDRLPFPLSFLSDAPTEVEDESQRRTAADSVRKQFDDNLYRALAVLAEPLVQVLVCGFDGPSSDRMIRVHAGCNQSFGAVIQQLPGHKLEFGADVVMSLHRVDRVTARVVDALPSVNAGTQKGITVHKSDLRTGQQGSLMQSAGHESARTSAKRFLDRPHTSFGEITIAPGNVFDGQPANGGAIVQWIDYANDGRYLIRNTQTIAAIPASAETMTAEVQRLVGKVLTRQAAS